MLEEKIENIEFQEFKLSVKPVFLISLLQNLLLNSAANVKIMLNPYFY